MGMFDWIKCEVALPGNPPSWVVEEALGGDMQSRDTPRQQMIIYTISDDGRLLESQWAEASFELPDSGEAVSCKLCWDPVEVPYHGDLHFYTGNGTPEGWHAYRARFVTGRLASIEQIAPIEPAPKPAPGLDFICEHCGALSTAPDEAPSVDTGTALRCEVCQRDTVVVLMRGEAYETWARERAKAKEG